MNKKQYKHSILIKCLEGLKFVQGVPEQILEIIPYRDEINNQGHHLISVEGIGGYIFFNSGENQRLKENNRYTDYCGGAPHDLCNTKNAPTIGEQLNNAPSGAEFLLVFSTSGEDIVHNPQIFIL